MSKVLDEIKAQLTDQHYVPMMPSVNVSMELDDNSVSAPHEYMVEWNVKAEFGYKVRGYRKDKHNIVKNVFEELRHTIYDEWFSLMYKMERAFYEQDYEQQRMLFREVHRLMEGKSI